MKAYGAAWPLEWNTRHMAAPYCQSRTQIESPHWRAPRQGSLRYRATALAPGDDAAHSALHSFHEKWHPMHRC